MANSSAHSSPLLALARVDRLADSNRPPVLLLPKVQKRLLVLPSHPDLLGPSQLQHDKRQALSEDIGLSRR